MQLRERYPDFDRLGVRVIGVVGQNPSGVEAFLSAEPMPFPLLIDPDRSVIKAYGVYHLLGFDAYRIARPSTFLTDMKGQVRYVFVGSNQREWPDLNWILAEAERLGLTDRRC